MTDTYSARTGLPERRKNRRHLWFLNATFDRINFDQTVARIAERSADAPFRYIVTPNVDHLVRLRAEPGWVHLLYAQAWLTVCDSRVLELLASFSGEQIDVTPGSDLTAYVFAHIIAPDDPITIIGADEGIVEKLKNRFSLRDVRVHQPPMGLRHKPDAIEACAHFIAKNPSRFVFLCVGSPQQEMIAKACLDRGDCTGVGLCVGASLDFLAGKTRRAPVWMQKWRLEWLHRLATEPKRMWRRYLVDGPKVLLLWWQWRAARAKLHSIEKPE